MNRPVAALIAVHAAALAATPENVLLVVNNSSEISRSAAEYYARKRNIPGRNVCRIRVDPAEEIDRDEYASRIMKPVAGCLTSRGLRDTIFYIVVTAGLPLRIRGAEGMNGDVSSVDSELALLYTDMLSPRRNFAGSVPNPMFGRTNIPAFNHRDFPIYLVTRLAGYDVADIRGLVDRALDARNRGKFIFDLRANGDPVGDDWLRAAARQLPPERVIVEDSPAVLYHQENVIGYASWGSNDANRHERLLNFEWRPGAIMTEYVSTNARTFERPPASWRIGLWSDPPKTFFALSPQTLIGDYIHEGVTGTSGHVAEPFLTFTPRPDFLFPAYFKGRTLAESYYLSIPALSWQNIVVGDPLCILKQ